MHLGHRGAADDAVHQLRHVFRRQPQLPRLVLGDVDAQHFARLVPVVDDLAQVGVFVQQGRQFDGVLAHLVDVFAADTRYWIGRPTGGPISSGCT